MKSDASQKSVEAVPQGHCCHSEILATAVKAALLSAILRDAKGTTHCDRGISCDVDLTIRTLDDDHGDSLTLHSGRNVFEGHRESCQILGAPHGSEVRGHILPDGGLGPVVPVLVLETTQMYWQGSVWGM